MRTPESKPGIFQKPLVRLAAAGALVAASLGGGNTFAGDDDKVIPGELMCWDAEDEQGRAPVYNLTPVEANGPGNGQIVSSDVKNDPPLASAVNYREGSVDPNVTITTNGSDGEVCYANSTHSDVHIVADKLGSLSGDAWRPAKPDGSALRQVDTRIGQGGGRIGPGEVRCWDAEDEQGRAPVYNLTPVEANGPGNGQIVSSDVKNDPPLASAVNYREGSVDPNVTITTNGSDGEVCYANSTHSDVHIVADKLGSLSGDAWRPAKPDGSALRQVDTRIGQGGGRIGPGEVRCWDAEDEQGRAPVYNLTPVEANGPGNGQIVSSDVKNDPPLASAVNYREGSVDPNVTITTNGSDGEVCYANSTHSDVHIVADKLGSLSGDAWRPAKPDGSALRQVDTRLERPFTEAGPQDSCEKVAWLERSLSGESMYAVYDDATGEVSRFSAGVETAFPSDFRIDPNQCDTPTIVYMDRDHRDPGSQNNQLYERDLETGEVKRIPVISSLGFNLDNVGVPDNTYSETFFVQYAGNQQNLLSSPGDGFWASEVSTHSVSDTGTTIVSGSTYSNPYWGEPGEYYTDIAIRRINPDTGQQRYSAEVFALSGSERIGPSDVSPDGENVYALHSTDKGVSYTFTEASRDPANVDPNTGINELVFDPISLIGEGIESFRPLNDGMIVAVVDDSATGPQTVLFDSTSGIVDVLSDGTPVADLQDIYM